MTTAVINPPSIPTTYTSFEDYYNSLQSYMSRNSDWNTTIPNGVGSTLLAILASMATSIDYFSSRRVQENYLQSAQSPFSIYTNVFTSTGSLLGNNPSTSQVFYTRNGTNTQSNSSILIPAYTQWSLNGTQFFNIEDLDFSASYSTGNFFLTEGTPTTSTFLSNGNSYQIFNVSSQFMGNYDVILFATDPISGQYVQWEKVDSLIDSGYYYYTDQLGQLVSAPRLTYESCVYIDGSVRIKFGDGNYGQIPLANTNISITFYESSGGNYNVAYSQTSSMTPTLVTPLSFNGLPFSSYFSNIASYSIQDGSPAPSYLSYKSSASNISASRNFLGSVPDFESNLLLFTYGDNGNRPIIGCKCISGSELSNKNYLLANTAVPVLLMNPSLFQNIDFKNQLAEYLSNNALFSVINPVLANIDNFDIIVNVVYYDKTFSQNQLTTAITNALLGMVLVQSNSVDSYNNPVWNVSQANSNVLGATYHLSDFYNTLLPVIGNNTLTISYSFRGSSDVFTLEPYECIGFNLLDPKAIVVNIATP